MALRVNDYPVLSPMWHSPNKLSESYDCIPVPIIDTAPLLRAPLPMTACISSIIHCYEDFCDARPTTSKYHHNSRVLRTAVLRYCPSPSSVPLRPRIQSHNRRVYKQPPSHPRLKMSVFFPLMSTNACPFPDYLILLGLKFFARMGYHNSTGIDR